MILDLILDAAMDSVRLLPFLFAAFCILEAASHHSGHFHFDLTSGSMSRFRYAGPLIGALLGCIPQCGIPVLAINLYCGLLLTPGTLIAVLVSTSDEAVLLLLKDPAGQKILVPLLAVKVLAGTAAGYTADLLFPKVFARPQKTVLHKEDDFCHRHGVFLSALGHTLELFTYIFVFSLILNILLETAGVEGLAHFLLKGSPLQPFVTALIGLIPNCAAPVLLCSLYLDGIISFSALAAGFCTTAGVGLAVLFRVGLPKKEVMKILLFLYITAAATGFILS